MSTDYSRTLLLAGSAAGTDQATLRERLEATRVHVTADPHLPAVEQTLGVLISNLRRLPIELSLDPGSVGARLGEAVLDSLQRAALGIDPDRPLRLGSPDGDALHLHLGTEPPSAAAVSAVPDGHGVRLRHRGYAFPRLAVAGTGLGAVITAASLTGEAFKIVTGLRPGAFTALPILDFCPVLPGSDPGTSTHSLLPLAGTTLVGAGAIGTAIALILDLLEATGELTVVDPEVFEAPNVTTYSLGTRRDAELRLPKVDLVARQLGRLNVTRVPSAVQGYLERIDEGTAPWPTLVLGAVDKIEARHDLQRLHVDLTLDGSTGGRAGTTLALHEALPTGPCLYCYYPVDSAGPSAERRLQQVTGLSMERIARGDERLVERDLEGLSPGQRALLAAHLGERVCGLSNLPDLIGDHADGYRPSAAFVAQQAACLVVGAWIARTSGLITDPMRHIEYDARFGPRPQEMTAHRRPTPNCNCQLNADLIRRVRAARRYGR